VNAGTVLATVTMALQVRIVPNVHAQKIAPTTVLAVKETVLVILDGEVLTVRYHVVQKIALVTENAK
tara:strand:+ start:547 stop:747 length:201 start_codon:yes stop_codon:yes gene_type:complete